MMGRDLRALVSAPRRHVGLLLSLGLALGVGPATPLASAAIQVLPVKAEPLAAPVPAAGTQAPAEVEGGVKAKPPAAFSLPEAPYPEPGYLAYESGVKRLGMAGPWLRILRVGRYRANLDGFMNWKVWYQLAPARNGGFGLAQPVVQDGPGFDALHPVRMVWHGTNSFVPSGDIVVGSNREVFVPFYYPPLDDAGQYYNPLHAYTYTNSGVLIGRLSPDGSAMHWTLGDVVALPPDQSTRGANETAIAELDAPGRFLMVIRGSNEVGGKTRPQPGCVWKAISTDYCRTWSTPSPFAYSDSGRFFAPSACSALLRNSRNHRLYWFGNLSATNPVGNWPRYPLVVGEVDEGRCALIKETVVTIATRDPRRDSDRVQFSNFSVEEDEATGSFILKLDRVDDGRPAAVPAESTHLEFEIRTSCPAPDPLAARPPGSLP